MRDSAFAWQMAAVFSLSLVVDVFWTKYNLAVSAGRPVSAGLWSAAIVIGGTFSLQIWLDNRWTLAASAIGAYFGTWWTVRAESRKKT